MDAPKKITYHYSPHWILAVVILVALCVCAYWYYDSTKTNGEKRIRGNNGDITRIQGNVTKLNQQFSDARLTQTRDEAAKLRESMMSGADADAFVASLRPTWTVVSRSEDSNDEFTKRFYQLARGSTPVSEWHDVSDLFTRLSKMPALVVNSIDIQTVGDNRRRDFSRIGLAITIYIKKQN